MLGGSSFVSAALTRAGVAVTGTISIDGMVGQIGEIQQKAISAKAAVAS